jgi:hypothetical protein
MIKRKRRTELKRLEAESRSRWPHDLRLGVCGRLRAGIVGSNRTGAWMSISCECCVLSGRGLCDGLITFPGESYRVWRVQLSVIAKPRQ